jgi:hypothetical protein
MQTTLRGFAMAEKSTQRPDALLERHVAAGTVREDFQRLVSEGVSTVGLETMKEIKNRIREGIVQQDLDDLGRRDS